MPNAKISDKASKFIKKLDKGKEKLDLEDRIDKKLDYSGAEAQLDQLRRNLKVAQSYASYHQSGDRDIVKELYGELLEESGPLTQDSRRDLLKDFTSKTTS